MKPVLINELMLTPLFAILPSKMNTPNARAMLLAIGLQESKFKYRKQFGGPAKGFWQFELNGVKGVLNHSASQDFAVSLLRELVIPGKSKATYKATQYNDLLAAGFARLLLWTLPDALPEQEEINKGWEQYIEAWRPGKPHKETWETNWTVAWETINHAA